MSSQVQMTPIDKFDGNVEDFIVYLQELFTDCSESGCEIVPKFALDFGINSIREYATRELIESFIEYSNQYWVEIYNKNEKFFDDNLDKVFEGLKMDNVGLFKKLLLATDSNGELVVSTTDRENIWLYLHSFVKIALHFIHEERRPVILIKLDGSKTAIYKKEYLKEINLPGQYSLWRKTYPDFRRRFSHKEVETK